LDSARKTEETMRILSAVLVFVLVLLPALAADKAVSDDQIIDQVHLKIANDPDVGSRKIEIEVHEGTVTLKGKVRTEKQKEKAEKLVKKVKGVTGVVNQLVVSQD
jgi:osmotically-inducible protein OsmY